MTAGHAEAIQLRTLADFRLAWPLLRCLINDGEPAADLHDVRTPTGWALPDDIGGYPMTGRDPRSEP